MSGLESARVDDVVRRSTAMARHFAAQASWSRAMPHYIVALRLGADRVQDGVRQEEVLVALAALTARLSDCGKLGDLWSALDAVAEVLADNAAFWSFYGGVLRRENCTEESERCFVKALGLQPRSVVFRHALQNLRAEMIDTWHLPMLNDYGRNDAFRSAIRAVISSDLPIKSVLDIGTGSGLLSLYVADASSRTSVYACEANLDMFKAATRVLALNGADRRIKLIPKLSTHLTDVDVPEKIDLLVTETFDAGLFGEHVLETLDHAWKYLLSDTALVLPKAATVYVTLIECNEIDSKHVMNRARLGHLEASPLESPILAAEGEEPYSGENLRRIPYKLLSQPKKLMSVDFNDRSEIEQCLRRSHPVHANLTCISPGKMSAVCVWFKLDLGNECEVSTAPDADSCWDQAVYPLNGNAVLQAGAEVRAEFEMKGHLRLISCRVNTGEEHERARISSQVMPTFVISECNSLDRIELYKTVSEKLMENERRALKILDASASSILALQFAKLESETCVTLLVSEEDEFLKKRIDHVFELAQRNAIALGNVSCMSLDKCEDDDTRYDLVVVDPVDASGRLNQSCFSEIPRLCKLLRPTEGRVLPGRISLLCQLFESEQILSLSKMTSNESVHNFRISEVMQPYILRYMNDLSTSTFDMKLLSEAFPVTALELSSIQFNQEVSVCSEISVTASGSLNGIYYWFELDYGFDRVLSTLRDKSFRQCSVMLPVPQQISAGDKIKLECRIVEGLVDFDVC